jgi:hydrogenase maturation protease
MKVKIIGLGNSFRGDDAVGNFVARELLPFQNSSISILEGSMAGLNLIHEMEGAEKLILIDAVSGPSEAGTILRLTIPQDIDEIQKWTWSSSTSSTHAFGVGEALMLAHTLDLLPQEVILYGVAIDRIHQGEPLSPLVSQSFESVVQRIVKEELKLEPCTNSNSCARS